MEDNSMFPSGYNPDEAKKGMYLKGKDFLGEGLVLKIAEKTKREIANDPKFGDAEGLTNIYTFETKEGNLMQFSSSSSALANLFIKNHIQVGDLARIKAEKIPTLTKTGEPIIGEDGQPKEWTRYTITKIELDPVVDIAKALGSEDNTAVEVSDGHPF